MPEKHAKKEGKAWERFNGWYIIGFVKNEGGSVEFHSMFDNQYDAHRQYRKLLKDESINCMVFATKVVASMDKIVKYVFDKEKGKDPRVESDPFYRLFAASMPLMPSGGDKGFNQMVTKYIKALVEKEEDRAKRNSKN